jgi:hypothetical protein
MLNVQVKPIPEKEKDDIKAAWRSKIPAVADKLETAKSDQEFRKTILEIHGLDETALTTRVGG